MQLAYFQKLNQVLRSHERSLPFLIIDRDVLDQNIDTLLRSLRSGVDFRIVVKSLPAPDLLRYVMDKSGSHKLMAFHQPFLSDISQWLDERADVLLGKPMPVKTAAYYYRTVQPKQGFDPFRQVQWLVDTEQRLWEYRQLAEELGQPLRLNLEIDVGLHRGGFAGLPSLQKTLTLIAEHSKQLIFSGFMGYEPHIVKLPKVVRTEERAFQMADRTYADCIDLLRSQFPSLWHQDLTFNGGGSPTLSLHGVRTSVINEISAGSCLVKPSTFDIPSLEAYRPACFIAAPVLKKMEHTTLPGIEKLAPLLGRLKSSFRQSYFIYGGYWKADYVFPEGTRENALFGPSTNQSLINVPPARTLEVDDFVFLRPRQSEFVFLQFGDLLVYKNGEMVGAWKPLSSGVV